MQKITLKPGREKIVRQGHPWLFSGALKTRPAAEPGTMVIVESASGEACALAFYHPESDIALRILTTNANAAADTDFWRARMQEAIALRKTCMPPATDAYRLINAEGDGFPGLIADLYAGTLVLSISTAGMERLRGTVIGLFQELIGPDAVIERSEGRARSREGLAARNETVSGPEKTDSVLIMENGSRYLVDVYGGQKTGFFLDQRDNRALAGRLARGMHVLNCFSYTGGFSVSCLAGGAERVASVDLSAEANALAVKNLELNGFRADMHPVITANVFDYLRASEEQFDFVILDPPAFAKTARDVQRAARGYKDIHMQAMKRLKPGGLLASFSCSNFIDADLFSKIVRSAAEDTGLRFQVLKFLGPGADHPTLIGHPEGRYLKGILGRVVQG
ncbi:class I SAM-dependent rRNA methyltransferase [bacterium]|nr:class I SAM-dependent rRNA methyltransferase [bacterium]